MAPNFLDPDSGEPRVLEESGEFRPPQDAMVCRIAQAHPVLEEPHVERVGGPVQEDESPPRPKNPAKLAEPLGGIGPEVEGTGREGRVEGGILEGEGPGSSSKHDAPGETPPSAGEHGWVPVHGCEGDPGKGRGEAGQEEPCTASHVQEVGAGLKAHGSDSGLHEVEGSRVVAPPSAIVCLPDVPVHGGVPWRSASSRCTQPSPNGQERNRNFKVPLGGGGKVGQGAWPSKLLKSR